MAMATIPVELLTEYRDVKVQQRAKDYLVDDVSYKRVSTILGVINKPALVPWAKKITLEKVEEILRNPEVETGLKTLFAEPVSSAAAPEYNAWVDRLLVTVKSAADQKRDEAASRGTAIHQEITALLSEGVLHPGVEIPISDEANQALQFLTDLNIRVEATEMPLWDNALRIAGTCDAVGWDRGGRRIIWDWKTGSGPWWEMALQLGAYAGMLEGLTGVPVADAYIVKLKPETYEVHRVLNLDDAWDTFVHAAWLQSASSVKWFG